MLKSIRWTPRNNNEIADALSKQALRNGSFAESVSDVNSACYLFGVWDGAFDDGIAGSAFCIFASRAPPGGQVHECMQTIFKAGVRCNARSAQQSEILALMLLVQCLDAIILGRGCSFSCQERSASEALKRLCLELA